MRLLSCLHSVNNLSSLKSLTTLSCGFNEEKVVKTKTKGKTVSIRLHEEDEDLLRAEASQGNISIGKAAESLLSKSLRKNGDEELGYIRQKVVELEGELQSLRQDLHDCVKTILLSIVDQNKLTKSHVEEWFS